MSATAHQAWPFPTQGVRVARALGAHLWTEQGTRLVDLGGASHGVNAIGHCHPKVVDAITRQAHQAIHLVPGIESAQRDGFLDALHGLLPPHLSRSFLSNSGAEAVEAAIKYAVAATGRTHLVAAVRGFHGRTLGALAATHRHAYRAPFQSMMPSVDFVPFNDPAALDQAVTDQTAAILLEPVQGEGGVRPATRDFLQAARQAADDHQAMLVLDEVQTGMGRTGGFLACQALGVDPDLVAMGKGLAGGLPIGVTSMRAEIEQALPQGAHGTTFGGSPMVCAAATAALHVLRSEDLLRRAAIAGSRILQRLQALAVPEVREVRGLGMMFGIDLRHRATATLKGLLGAGYLALAAGPTVVRWLPPLNIESSVLDKAVDALRTTLEANHARA